MRTSSLLLLTGLLTAANTVYADGYVFVILEQKNAQTSESGTEVRDYMGSVMVEGIAEATAATVSLNSGTPEPLASDGDVLEYREPISSELELTTNFPLNGTYTVNVTGTPNATSTLTGPGGSFADLRPANPVFTLGGVTGTWSTVLDENNLPVGIFTFDPTGVTSFTVTLNAFVAGTPGGHYGGYASVGLIDGETYNFVDEVGYGPEEIPETPGTTVFTFTKGEPADGGDGNSFTYGFVDGDFLELEGGFFNVIGLSDSGLGDGSEKGFVFGSVTTLLLKADSTSAIPEPSSYATLVGCFALAGALLRRRQRRM
jgi:hypothetical protein